MALCWHYVRIADLKVYRIIGIMSWTRGSALFKLPSEGWNKMDYENDEITIDMAELFTLLWKRLPIILLCTVAAAAISFAVNRFMITPQFQANALMIVNTRQDAAATVTSDQINSATKLVDTYSIIIKSDTVLQQVINNLQLNLDYDELLEKVTVEAVDSTQVMRITVTDPNVEAARVICEQITQVAPNVIVETVEAGSVKVISQAAGDPIPVSPRVKRNTAICGLLGMMVCVAVIVLRMLLDNKINSEADVTKYLDLPVLGVIPKYEGGK